MNPMCRDQLLGCITGGGLTYIRADYPATTQSLPCPGASSQSEMTIDLGPLFTSTGLPAVTHCDSVQFADLRISLPFMPEDDLVRGGVVLRHGALSPPCSFTLRWIQGAIPQPIYALMDLRFANTLHSLVPIMINTTAGTCGGATPTATPKYVDKDGVANCMLVPDAPNGP